MPGAKPLGFSAAGLTEAEYNDICTRLKREPNFLELGMFGVLWSEHCSYKHSRPLLRRLPTTGAHVLHGPGENAGAVHIGDGLAAVMKMESHNHPSAVEPFQGAATGVGGILRDIFTMGARPIALLDALCFGPPSHPRTKYLLEGVVGGIAFYGNCVGVPTVGGSISFDPSYAENPLVNVLCLGIAPADKLITAHGQGVGNPVLLVGSATGRDGIAGASFASAELNAASEEQRPAVQVGNPFLQKLLIEACLELIGDPDIVAMQDLGAAGITGAVAETAAHGNCGIDIDVRQVSRRELSMTPYEVMLSESQERMLVVVRRGAEERVRALFTRWELQSDVIGSITADGLVRVRDGSNVVANVPALLLSGGTPEYVPPQTMPRSPVANQETIPLPPEPADLAAVLLRLLASPSLASRRPVFEQYDHMVQTNTVVPPGAGAAVLRVKGTNKGLALGLGSNGRVCAADPYVGGAWVVAEACRNVACAGGRPIALTDCLNFGDPERGSVWESMSDVVEGIRAASLALDVPVISGNVSLYNETNGHPILPTPIVGALGLLEDIQKHARAAFVPDQDVWLLGPLAASLDQSEYGAAILSWQGSNGPTIDLDLERRVQACVRELIGAGVTTCAGDVSEGGLATALAELALAGGTGVVCDGDWLDDRAQVSGERLDALLFGEGSSRILVGAPAAASASLTDSAKRWNVAAVRLGHSGGTNILIGDVIRVTLEEAGRSWGTAFDRMVQG